MNYISIALIFSLKLNAMHYIGRVDEYEQEDVTMSETSESEDVSEYEQEYTNKQLNWQQFLHRIAHEAPPKTTIYYQGEIIDHPTANGLALTHIAHLSFTKATDYLGKTFLPEDGHDLFHYKNTLADSYFVPATHTINPKTKAREGYYVELAASDPYILFCYLPTDLKKRVLTHLELTSGEAQNKFLGMKVCRAFSYYAVCQENRNSLLSFDLYFLLGTRKQAHCMESLICTKKDKFEEAELTWLPKEILEGPAYAQMMGKKITVLKAKPHERKGVVIIPEEMTIKEACTQPKGQFSIPPTFSPTILSKAVARFPSIDYTWLLSRHD